MSVHDKLVEHAFRRWEMQEQTVRPVDEVRTGTGTAQMPDSRPRPPGAQRSTGRLRLVMQAGIGSTAATMAPAQSSAQAPLQGGAMPRPVGFRRVAVVVRSTR